MHKIEKDRLFTSPDGMDFSREYYLCDSLDELERMLATDSMLRCEVVSENGGSGGADCPFWGECTMDWFRYAYDVPDELREGNVMTNIELAEWLAKGNGLVKWQDAAASEVYTYLILDEDSLNAKADEDILIRAWDEQDWHRPWRE